MPCFQEAESAGPDGRQTVGLRRRRAVRSLPELTTHVGKESNELEAVEAGLEHDTDEVWTEYADRRRDPWWALVLPVLKRMPAKELAAATGLSERAVKALRNGRARPRPAHRASLVRAAGGFAADRLREAGDLPPIDNLAACAAYLADSSESSSRCDGG
jgi:hypothetical protein